MDLLQLYEKRKGEIQERLRYFETFQQKPFSEILPELCFCLLTPGTSAERADEAIQLLMKAGHLQKVQRKGIAAILKGRVRFHNQKTNRIVLAAKMKTIQFERQWLVENVQGLGWKEASHFLRNVGHGKDLAIIDRHILKNMKELGIIKKIPKSLSKNTYLSLEKKLQNFSEKINIPVEELDLLLWSKETGRVFK